MVGEITDLRGNPVAATTGVLAYFADHVIDQEDVETFLPLRFV